jgi:hypothetical protein
MYSLFPFSLPPVCVLSHFQLLLLVLCVVVVYRDLLVSLKLRGTGLWASIRLTVDVSCARRRRRGCAERGWRGGGKAQRRLQCVWHAPDCRSLPGNLLFAQMAVAVQSDFPAQTPTALSRSLALAVHRHLSGLGDGYIADVCTCATEREREKEGETIGSGQDLGGGGRAAGANQLGGVTAPERELALVAAHICVPTQSGLEA